VIGRTPAPGPSYGIMIPWLAPSPGVGKFLVSFWWPVFGVTESDERTKCAQLMPGRRPEKAQRRSLQGMKSPRRTMGLAMSSDAGVHRPRPAGQGISGREEAGAKTAADAGSPFCMCPTLRLERYSERPIAAHHSITYPSAVAVPGARLLPLGNRCIRVFAPRNEPLAVGWLRERDRPSIGDVLTKLPS
jgi:hypothetical protein